MCDGDREEEIQVDKDDYILYIIFQNIFQISRNILFFPCLQDPHPVQKLVRKEGRRPAILLGLRDNENDFGVIKVMIMMRMIMIMKE